jgi:hypothetical protein
MKITFNSINFVLIIWKLQNDNKVSLSTDFSKTYSFVSHKLIFFIFFYFYFFPEKIYGSFSPPKREILEIYACFRMAFQMV